VKLQRCINNDNDRPIVCCGASEKRITLEEDNLEDTDLDTRGDERWKCNNGKCLRYYRGYWTAPGNCSDKEREVATCPKTNSSCCAPPCSEKPACIRAGGYCVESKRDCPGKAKTRWCNGRKCACCIVERPTTFKNTSSHDLDICGPEVSFDMIGGAIVNVHSPNYPLTYPPDLNCSVTINLVNVSALHFSIALIESSLEECSYDQDGYDTLTFGNNSFCGVNSSATYIVNEESVTFNFVTDDTQSNFGFFAIVSAGCDSQLRKVPEPQYRTSNYATVCNDTYINATSGLISSYNHPCKYAENLYCSLEVEVPAGHVLNVTYLEFHLEDGFCYDYYYYSYYYTYCYCYDWLAIYDIGPGVYNLAYDCGRTIPGNFISGSNKVKIKFSSDHMVVDSGFLLYFNAVLP